MPKQSKSISTKIKGGFDLRKLIPNPTNPRQITPQKFDELKKSLQDFPKMMEMRPIIYDEGGVVLGGNMRYKALMDLGYSDVPQEWVKCVTELTEQQKKEFVIKDNNSYGEYDWDILANEYGDLPLAEWGIDLPDYFAESEVTNKDEDAVPAIKVSKLIRQGDLFIIDGIHRLLCGDAGNADDVALLMNEHQADMVFTDPPYNVNYIGTGENTSTVIRNDHLDAESFDELLDKWMAQYKKWSKEGAGLYIFHASTSQAQFEKAICSNGFVIKNQLIWNKPSLSLGWGDYHWKHEPFFYCGHADCKTQWYGDRSKSTVWDFQKDEKKLLDWALKMKRWEAMGKTSIWSIARDPTRAYLHPTQKPVELIRMAIVNSSKQGDLVMDLFMGSGSALVACDQTRRVSYGMEIDPVFVRTTLQRFHDLKPNATFQCQNRKFDFELLWHENC